MNDGDSVKVSINAIKTPIRKDTLLAKYQGTRLTQDVVTNGKVGTPVLIKSDKYGYQFKNHNKFKYDKKAREKDNQKIYQLNKLKVNSKVVMANGNGKKQTTKSD